MLVLGDKEQQDGTVAVRNRAGESSEMPLADFINKLADEIESKKS